MDEQQRVTRAQYDDFGRIVELDKPSLAAAMGTIAVLYVDTYGDEYAPIRTVHYRTGFGSEGTTGATTAPSYVDHYVYLDSFGDERAVVDAVDPGTHSGNSWVLSGVHSTYANGRVLATVRPMFLTGAGPVLGALPSLASSPNAPSATKNYDGLGRVTGGIDYTFMRSKMSITWLRYPPIRTDQEQGPAARIKRSRPSEPMAMGVSSRSISISPSGPTGRPACRRRRPPIRRPANP